MDEEMIKNLIRIAREARENSYAPYSRFHVGAALLAKSGKIYTGCNIESVSFSPTVCAERVALFKAVSEGEREFEMLAVIGGPEDDNKKCQDDSVQTSGPCGVCRQMIYEFGTDIKIVVADSEDKYYIRTISEFLPQGFGPSNLI